MLDTRVHECTNHARAESTCQRTISASASTSPRLTSRLRTVPQLQAYPSRGLQTTGALKNRHAGPISQPILRLLVRAGIGDIDLQETRTSHDPLLHVSCLRRRARMPRRKRKEMLFEDGLTILESIEKHGRLAYLQTIESQAVNGILDEDAEQPNTTWPQPSQLSDDTEIR